MWPWLLIVGIIVWLLFFGVVWAACWISGDEHYFRGNDAAGGPAPAAEREEPNASPPTKV